jgi:hypothetical protein
MKVSVTIKKGSRSFKRKEPEMDKMTRHHRRCRSNGGSNDDSNISIVPERLHIAYHQLFKNLTAGGIAHLLNEVWIDKEVKLVVVKRKGKR